MTIRRTPGGKQGARTLPAPLLKALMPIMERIHRRSGDRFRGSDLLYLTTVGARTGTRRATPVARFDDGLATETRAAHARMTRVLDRVDAHIAQGRIAHDMLAPDRPAPLLPAPAPTRLDLRAEGIGTVVLATGLRPDYSWLRLPVVGTSGEIVQRRGVTGIPGVYVVGQHFQHRRDSTFIHGARHNARDVVSHLVTGSVGSAGHDDVAFAQ